MGKSKFSKAAAAVLTVAMVAALFIVPVIPAQCATSGVTTVKPDTVYTTLDVTGNGKKDRFKAQRKKSGSWYNTLTISVNGKEALKISKTYEGVVTKLIKLSNGKKYLFVNCYKGDEFSSVYTALLQYKSGKFVKVTDFDKIFRPHAGSWDVRVWSVAGNTIKYRIITHSTYSNGGLNGTYLIQYTYRSGTMFHIIASDKLMYFEDGSRTAYAYNSCNAYTDTTRTKKAFSVPKGARVTIDQCRISSSRVLLHVKYGSKYGWIVASDVYLNLYY